MVGTASTATFVGSIRNWISSPTKAELAQKQAQKQEQDDAQGMYARSVAARSRNKDSQGHRQYHTMYEILHVESNASLSMIKRSYVNLALKAHPDRARIAREAKQDCTCDERSPPKGGGKPSKTKEDDWYAVTQAWSVLSDEAARSEYNEGMALRKALFAFYTDHNPAMIVHDIEQCLKPGGRYLGGNESDLFGKLQKRYALSSADMDYYRAIFEDTPVVAAVRGGRNAPGAVEEDDALGLPASAAAVEAMAEAIAKEIERMEKMQEGGSDAGSNSDCSGDVRGSLFEVFAQFLFNDDADSSDSRRLHTAVGVDEDASDHNDASAGDAGGSITGSRSSGLWLDTTQDRRTNYAGAMAASKAKLMQQPLSPTSDCSRQFEECTLTQAISPTHLHFGEVEEIESVPACLPLRKGKRGARSQSPPREPAPSHDGLVHHATFESASPPPKASPPRTSFEVSTSPAPVSYVSPELAKKLNRQRRRNNDTATDEVGDVKGQSDQKQTHEHVGKANGGKSVVASIIANTFTGTSSPCPATSSSYAGIGGARLESGGQTEKELTGRVGGGKEVEENTHAEKGGEMDTEAAPEEDEEGVALSPAAAQLHKKVQPEVLNAARKRQDALQKLADSEQLALGRSMHRKEVANTMVHQKQQQYNMLVRERKAAFEKIHKSFQTYKHEHSNTCPRIDLGDI
jgi:hypothetical protein